MPTWYIEPRDPLIVRDGRPFGPDPGARSRSIGFPMPSTTTGGLRNRAGLNQHGAFNRGLIDTVLKIAVRGPLLAALDPEGTFQEWLPPAPADALLLPGDQQNVRIVRLLPLQKISGTSYTHPAGDPDLALVGPRLPIDKKPFDAPPQFWHWGSFIQWLLHPEQERFQHTLAPTTLGVVGPTRESRTHVGIDPLTQTAEDGRLFQTNGLEFTMGDRQRLALVIESVAALKHFTTGGFAPLGGERRLVAWRTGAPPLPDCPPAIREHILHERGCRVVLLTPAHFTHGYRPMWLLCEHGGMAATLAAALVQRPLTISGWDMQHHTPKPTRRLAPAGSVYFLKFPQAATEEQISNWIDAIWMHNISDDDADDAERDRRDGFGLAVLGTWDGTLTTMEVS